MSFEHRVDKQSDRWIYVLSGEIDAGAAHELKRSVEQAGGELPERVVVDLRGLRECEPEARDVLVDVHRLWTERAQRIAYLATEPRFRGLSLWIMHMVGDERAKAVGSEPQVEAWLGARAGRTEQALRTLGASAPVGMRGRQQALNVAERTTSRAVDWMMRLLIGFRVSWFEEAVRTYGMVRLARWTGAILAALDELTELHGDCYAQALIGVNAIWSGCRSCSRGHLLAANLLYFEETRRLFPLPESEVLRWQSLQDDVLRAEMMERLAGEEFAVLRSLIALQFWFKSGEVGVDADPTLSTLAKIEAAWTLISECSITDEGDTVTPLHSRMARDRRLQQAYFRARAWEKKPASRSQS